MKVLFATAELAPLARVGGLGAAAAGYVTELRGQGVDVEVALPDYSETSLQGQQHRSLAVPEWAGPASARSGIAAGAGQVTLIDVPGIRRPHPYVYGDGSGWWDNDRRFFAFSAAVASLIDQTRPDVVHLNDWHTATVLAHLPEPPPTVLTIHTLGYQGQANLGWLSAFPYRADLFGFAGSCNPLAGGIRMADLIVAVSPNYAREITHDDHGFGLAGLLRDRGDRLVGIRNGIDAREWDPQRDEHLGAHYDSAHVDRKADARGALLAEVDLPRTRGPVIAMVTRLVHQKGVDLALPIVEHLAPLDARLVVLGSGDAALADAMATAARAHPGEVAFRPGYDEALGHRIFAGADLFLMPSRFEPCGLAQMQAMRYGTLPVVTDVGGLHDTVIDIDAAPKVGTGVVAARPEAVAIMDGVHRATRAWSNLPRRRSMQRRGMNADWSWTGPVREHVTWYHKLLG